MCTFIDCRNRKQTKSSTLVTSKQSAISTSKSWRQAPAAYSALLLRWEFAERQRHLRRRNSQRQQQSTTTLLPPLLHGRYISTSGYYKRFKKQSPLPYHTLELRLVISMKPVVSALNAWSWYVVESIAAGICWVIYILILGGDYSVVVSVFAIIILSIIGALFRVCWSYNNT